MEGAGVLAQVSLGPMLEPHPHPCLGKKGADFQEKAAPTARSASKYVDHRLADDQPTNDTKNILIPPTPLIMFYNRIKCPVAWEQISDFRLMMVSSL